MKEEHKKFWKVASKLLIIVIFALLYSAGGTADMGGKWLRRFVAPFILCMAMWGYSRDWKALIQMPFMIIGLSFGYGATNLWGKILRRTIYGIANGSFCSVYNAIRKRWLLVWTQVGLVISMCIIFGVWNPISARAEETFLGVMIALIPILGAERKT